MKRVAAGAAIAFAGMLAQAQAQDAGPALSCDKSVAGKPGAEAAALRAQGGDVVQRLSRHVLQVRAGGRVHRFKDKPPYDQPLEGTAFRFCERKDGFVLVYEEDRGTFSGVLVSEATGKATRGGLNVIFSADRQAYFATSRTDGQDGDTWTIRFIDGRVSWEATAVLVQGERVLGDLEAPRWLASGEFAATARCRGTAERHADLVLRRVGGQWAWSPKSACR